MLEILQVQYVADDRLETGYRAARQHVFTSIRVHQRVPVGVVSVARVRAPLPADD